MDIDLNAAAVFAKVVEAKSFRGAAAALGLPKSTVSHKVAQLEDRLGVRLLERTTRALRLTDAGAAYHRAVSPALEALRDADRAVAGLSAEPTGTLRMTAPAAFGSVFFGEILSEYARRFPAVQVHVDLTDRQVDMLEEGFDLAVRAGRLPDSSLVARKIGRPKRFLLYASAAYLKRRGKPKHPSELVDHDCLVSASQRSPATWPFFDGRKALTVEVKAKIAVNSFRVLHVLALEGHGIARLPEIDDFADAARGDLRTVLDAFAPPPSQWHAVYPSARNLAPKVRAMVELLESRLPARR